MHTSTFRTLLTTCACLVLPLTACQQGDLEDAEVIDESIQQLQGGLDMQDEEPMFGEAQRFADADFPEERPVEDSVAGDAEVVAMEANPDAARIHAILRWGQIPVDMTRDEEMTWSGTIRVNRGALLVRRVIDFRGDRSSIEQRDDKQSVTFRSTTNRGSAGLRLLLVDPTPEASEPFTMEYVGNGIVHTVAVDDVLAGPQSVDVGESGDRIAIVAVRRQRDETSECTSGFLRGRWHKVAEHGGRLLGQVSNSEGDLVGHMRGIYGARRNGNKVFFGKYIGEEGAFRGLFAGRYQEGAFRGVWIHRSGEVGALGGHYRAGAAETRELGGHYLGRWAAKSCGIEVGPGRDMPDRPERP